MKDNKEFLRLPHFFLFKDLYYSNLEADKILNEILKGKDVFSAEEVRNIAKHYKVLYEILEFVHENTPDFFVINKIKDEVSEIVCFANKEFSRTFGIKNNPEGKDIYKLLTNKEEEHFEKFIYEQIKKAKAKSKESNEDQIEISVKSDDIEMPVIDFYGSICRLFKTHIKVVGSVKKSNKDIIFDGYAIVIGRDITEDAVQEQIAHSFTNIPKNLYKKFHHEAFRRKILGKYPKTITMKNVYVLTGMSDISDSAKMRINAEEIDEKENSHEHIRVLNKKIEDINFFLHEKWEECKKRLEEKAASVFLLEETDGLDYTVCFHDEEKDSILDHDFLQLREDEVRIMAEIAKGCVEKGYPLKHIIVAHDKKVNFYFEEKFESRFKIETQHVDLFIKKRRLEKANEKNSNKRVLKEGTLTVAVDNDSDFDFYNKLYEKMSGENIFLSIEKGEVEDLPGVRKMRFLRGIVSN